MAFVLDASVSLVWAFDDEDHPIASRALTRMLDENAVVPALWWFEVRSALLISERDGRSSEERTASSLRHLSDLPVTIDRDPDQFAIYDLSWRYGLTFYDAAYLELAKRMTIEIATLDRALVRAARAEHVPLVG